jgi:hypothetical protein
MQSKRDRDSDDLAASAADRKVLDRGEKGNTGWPEKGASNKQNDVMTNQAMK